MSTVTPHRKHKTHHNPEGGTVRCPRTQASRVVEMRSGSFGHTSGGRHTRDVVRATSPASPHLTFLLVWFSCKEVRGLVVTFLYKLLCIFFFPLIYNQPTYSKLTEFLSQSGRSVRTDDDSSKPGSASSRPSMFVKPTLGTKPSVALKPNPNRRSAAVGGASGDLSHHLTFVPCDDDVAKRYRILCVCVTLHTLCGV
jgi:hypothetical protein